MVGTMVDYGKRIVSRRQPNLGHALSGPGTEGKLGTEDEQTVAV